MSQQMKHFFLQYGRFFLLAFFIGFLWPRFSGANVQTDSIDYSTYSSIDSIVLAFHKDVNETTNEKIAQLITSTRPNVLYPASDSDCTDDNLSTYCLAYVLDGKLLAFEQALQSRKSNLSELQEQANQAENSLNTLTDAIQFANQQSAVVDEQMKNAEAAVELTLAVYNQIQIVYPLHTELKSFVGNLEAFRDNLATVRNVIEGYPAKFNGASTAQCK